MTTTAALTPQTQTSLPAQTARSAMITSDFDTFLRMLTVQIQNQDPLNPMQSTEFATQLATFSGVEQQVRTNEHLAGLSLHLGLSSLAQMSGWIGMEVRSAAPAHFAGDPITLIAQPAAGAETAELVVTDAGDNEVQRIAVPATAGPFVWSGRLSSGETLPDGAYRFGLESYGREGALGASAVEHYARVEEARGDGAGGVTLILDGGVAAPATAVTALRRAGGF